MTIKEIYNLAISKGVENDFRSTESLKLSQERLKVRCDKMSDEERKWFDFERLENPYSDTRILFGDPNKKVKKILAGIDIDGSEIFLAKEMKDIDLMISHHPRGRALAALDDVMQLQIDLLNVYGVPINVAEKITRKKIEEVSRSIASANHNRTVDMAKHLGIPLLCVHTPCDNMAAKFVDNKIKKDNPIFVEDVINSLSEIYEYSEAILFGTGPKIFLGGSDNRAGKIITEMTGGTEGAAEIYEKLSQAGIGTVVGMHISEKNRTGAESANINVVIAGHISSDSIGMNLFLDELQREGIEIVSCSGLIRYSRL
ncbi:MAG: NGG1p interacting factor NIF3 [Minisyncoccales bacterium]|jgi:putative NIF3 family GTP cyclohydrolase 1 type 2